MEEILKGYGIEKVLKEEENQMTFQSKDVRTGRNVVVKQYRLTTSNARDIKDECHKEVKRNSLLLTELFSQIIFLKEEKDRIFLVREYVDGKSLREILDKVGKIPSEIAIILIRETLNMMNEAHAFGIANLNLKPENVFLLADGRIQYTDISRIKKIHREEKLADELDSFLGFGIDELAWLKADIGKDIVSLGYFLCEILSGTRMVLEKKDVVGIFLVHDPIVPYAIREIVEKMIGKKYDSLKKIEEDVEKYVAELGQFSSYDAIASFVVEPVTFIQQLNHWKSEVCFNRGLEYLQKEEMEEAKREFEKSVIFQPQNIQAREELEKLLAKDGKTLESIGILSVDEVSARDALQKVSEPSFYSEVTEEITEELKTELEVGSIEKVIEEIEKSETEAGYEELVIEEKEEIIQDTLEQPLLSKVEEVAEIAVPHIEKEEISTEEESIVEEKFVSEIETTEGEKVVPTEVSVTEEISVEEGSMVTIEDIKKEEISEVSKSPDVPKIEEIQVTELKKEEEPEIQIQPVVERETTIAEVEKEIKEEKVERVEVSPVELAAEVKKEVKARDEISAVGVEEKIEAGVSLRIPPLAFAGVGIILFILLGLVIVKVFIFKPKITLESQEALLQKAKAKEEIGDYDGALGDYSSFVKRFPDYPNMRSVYFSLGNLYNQLGKTDKSLETYKMVVSSDSTDSLGKEAGFQRALIFKATKRKQEALSELSIFLEDSTGSLRALEAKILAGGLLYELGYKDSALVIYGRGMNEDKRKVYWIQMRKERGKIFEEKGEFKEARVEYDSILTNLKLGDPTHAWAMQKASEMEVLMDRQRRR